MVQTVKLCRILTITPVHVIVTDLQKGLIHAIINIYKYRFEILNAVYLDNAQLVFHEILHQSTAMQGNLFGILFIGLLDELPNILDSFSLIPQMIT